MIKVCLLGFQASKATTLSKRSWVT
eukprot:UN19330